MYFRVYRNSLCCPNLHWPWAYLPFFGQSPADLEKPPLDDLRIDQNPTDVHTRVAIVTS